PYMRSSDLLIRHTLKPEMRIRRDFNIDGEFPMKRSLPLLLLASLGALSACGGGSSSPPATATHFSVKGPANIPSAISFQLRVTALDDSNHTVPNYSGTVHFASTDPHVQLPADSTLESGTKIFSAILTTGGNQMITATDKG